MATVESLMKRTVAASDCLEYTGTICRSGYGLVWHDGKNRLAHRVSYELHNGPITGAQHVMHMCDNRKCINPKHLALGSRKDNMRDKESKGRGNHVSGSAHPKAKASPEVVSEIRRRYIPRHPAHGATALAREFGIAQQTVSHILRGYTWAP